ncbi:MazG nucleotide pyrophosphohydrolase domain-containing protein [Brachybacterium phenoliresistens]|uniref:MazG nucleotide pyrophosphohydrolase domain-containing protein n=1 Tax=Brachybacterium phenoliresistens TaxID=396014 RepID=UPI0031DC00F9
MNDEETAGAVPGHRLLRAVAVMDALRRRGGDAWSAQQTHQSLARYLLEETYEVLDVLEDPQAHAPGAVVDELGDLLFQILFHARIGLDEDPAWGIDDVADAFIAKMERRNPHVFGPEGALEHPEDVEAIIAQWHAVKAREKAEQAAREQARRDARREAAAPGSSPSDADADPGREPAPVAEHFSAIPSRLPALQTAAKAVHRARSAGHLRELLAAADAVVAAEDAPEGADLARDMIAQVVAAEARDVDPESALRALLSRTARELADPTRPGHPGDARA